MVDDTVLTVSSGEKDALFKIFEEMHKAGKSK
jgi:hypothetical protein